MLKGTAYFCDNCRKWRRTVCHCQRSTFVSKTAIRKLNRKRRTS